MKICDACGEEGFSQPSCRWAVCPNPLPPHWADEADAFGRKLEQAMSFGPLSASELGRDWWNRYLIDTRRFRFGYDLTCWALPLKLTFGRFGAFISFLCFDIYIEWSE